MKHYLLNHQPQKGLQAACAQQGQAPTCNARGKGHTSASPKTLTRILLVLLTMLLLPSAAWGQTTYEGGKVDVQDSQLGDDNNRTGTWGSWGVTWDDGITSVRKNQTGKLEFTAIGSKTGHITLSLTRTYSSEKICSVILSHTTNEVISIQSFKIGDNEISTNDYTHTTSSLSYNPNSPIEWAEGKEIKITIEINNTSSTEGISGLMIHTAEVKTATPYNLTVAGITVTDWNKDNVTGKTWWDDNTKQNIPYVSFTPAEETNQATLTLNGAEINYESGNVIVSTLTTPLKVALSGHSTINSGSYLPFEGATGDNANLVISGEDDASLVMDSKATGFSPTSFYTGFNNVSYEGYLYAYLSENNVVIEPATSYGITVAEVEVTSANCGDILDGDNKGKVSFKPKSLGADQATLTLNGAIITGGIDWSGSDNLTIALSGENSITNSGGAAINSSAENLDTRPTLTFVKAADATACSLTLTSGTNYINGFLAGSYVKPGSGLFYLVNESSATVTSTLLGGGSGTEADPLLITTADQLKDFSSYVNNGIITTEFVKLANDIDCSSLSGFTPIGDSNRNSFKGTFDGNDKTLSGLNIEDGLFGMIQGAKIEKLTISGSTVTGSSSGTKVAGIATEASENSRIENCTVINSTISCRANTYNPYAGGIVAQLSNSTITNCIVDNVQIKAETNYSGSGPEGFSGGIAANSNGGTISLCTVKNGTKVTNYYSDPAAGLYAGAIVGKYSSSTLTSNYYYYDVTVETKSGDAEVIKKSGYTHRGIGNKTNDETGAQIDAPDISENDGSVLYTKQITLPGETAEGTVMGMEDTYYNDTDDGILVTPGQTASIKVLTETRICSFKVVDSQNNEISTSSETVGTGNDAYTLYTFEMPDDHVTITATFAIDISGYTATIANATYTGEPLVPNTITLTSGEGGDPITLTNTDDNTDFTITGYTLNSKDAESPIDAGEYTINIEGSGNYTGIIESISYTIEKAAIEPVITLEGWTYGADPNEPSLEGNPGEGAVTWTYKYPNSENFVEQAPTATSPAGNYAVQAIVAETDNYYAGSTEAEFTIEQATIDGITLEQTELTFNGSAQTVTVTKVMAGTIEVAADYYEISGNTGTEAGNYKLIVTAKTVSNGNEFKNNFKGSAEKAWKINHRTIPAEVIAEKFTSEEQTYASFNNASESFLAPQGFVAYIITGVSGSSVTVKAVSYVKAGTPVLLQKTSTSTETEETTDGIFATNILKYAEGNLTANGGQYVLYKNEFVKATGSITSGKCYLDLTGTSFAGTRGFSIAGGAEGTTAISDAVADSDHSEWFDLQGRKIEKPSKKGLYIRDGKKIVVK